jgi:hypothetical protein
MSNLIVMTLLIVLVLLLVVIALHYVGAFKLRPADLPPFSDIKYAIEPSVLKQAKQDYNKIIDTIFSVVNNQTQLIDNDTLQLNGGGQPPLVAAIEEELRPLLATISKKYTPDVTAKLLKYFALKHIKVILDNYYLGPNIYFAVPDMPMFNIKAFPFVYEAKRKPGMKPRKGSTIAPFKYFTKNIPDRIRPQVSKLYDDLLKRYMRAFNKSVAHLPELNINTVKTIDINKTLKKYSPMMIRDFETVHRLFGANVARTVKAILVHNFLPLLNRFYKGPAINFTLPLTVPSNPHIVLINFPNTNKDDIIKVVRGCPKHQVLQTTYLDKEKGIVQHECVFPTTRSLSNLSTKKIDCPSGKSLQTTLIDIKNNIKVYECVEPTKAAPNYFTSSALQNNNSPMNMGPMNMGPMNMGPMNMGPMNMGPMNMAPMNMAPGPSQQFRPAPSSPSSPASPATPSSPQFKPATAAPSMQMSSTVMKMPSAVTSSPARPLTTTFSSPSSASSASSGSSVSSSSSSFRK